MSDMDEVDAYVREMVAAFNSDDVSWAELKLPDGTRPEVVEMAFHKARYECTKCLPDKRRESQRWLMDRGLTRMHGMTLQSGDPLPE